MIFFTGLLASLADVNAVGFALVAETPFLQLRVVVADEVLTILPSFPAERSLCGTM